MRITFYGAAETVTGSCFLLEDGLTRLLVDCGMFQGQGIRDWNRRPFPFEPSALGGVLLTHAHIDHSGLLPRLCKQGFKGPIFATAATTDLAEITLPDSGHIQEIEAEWHNRKRRRAGLQPVEPLYTAEDAFKCLKQFERVRYGEEVTPPGGLKVRFHDAGHILGSAFIDVHSASPRMTVRFSGDIGQTGQPIIRDPERGGRADFLVVESTYGGRKHEERTARLDILRDAVRATVERGGNVVIPAFAVGRTQELLYHLNGLFAAREIPRVPVFIDSPMAVSATAIFRRNTDCYDDETLRLLSGDGSPFDFDGLHMIRTTDESRELNNRPGPAIILSASGMCEAGRILHHLKYNLWRPESTILFVGYQAAGTLGRRLTDGEKRVHVLGEEIAVRASIRSIDGFSAHADEQGLVDWVGSLEEPPAKVFLVHGESDGLKAMSERLGADLGLATAIPSRGESFELIPGAARLVQQAEPAVESVASLVARIDRAWALLKSRWDGGLGTLPADVLERVASQLGSLEEALESVRDGKKAG